MPTWKIKGKGWRYQFQHQGKRYSHGWYATKTAARAGEEAAKAELKKAAIARTRTGMVFSEVANEYLDYAERRFAVKTYKYKAYVFRSFIAAVGDVPLSKITVSLLEVALRSRRTNTNYNRHRKDLCALFTWAWRRQYLSENPCFFLDKMPEPKFSRQIPSPEEMAAIIFTAGTERPFILTLYHTLARVDEVLRLRWEDINFTERTVTLWTRKTRGGGWSAGTLGMNEVLYQTLLHLWQNREQTEWVFFNPKTGSRYMRRPKLMKKLCKLAGVRPFGFHAIRHYVASLLHDTKKISLPQVSKLLRHTNKATTERYLQVVDQASRDPLTSLEDDFSTDLLTIPTHSKI